MKSLKYILSLIFIAFLIVGCSDDDTGLDPDPVLDLHKLAEFLEENYLIEIYSKKQQLEVGYNELSIRIKDIASDTYLKNVSPEWEPVMDMGDMEHGAPHSYLRLNSNDARYSGYIIFQMAGDHHHGWELNLKFNHNNTNWTYSYPITVRESSGGLVKTQTFTGADDENYILAYMQPEKPEVKINDMEAILYKMEDMMTFSIVENFTIPIDPRMPSMGNHSSPNNRDLSYSPTSETYKGKLSLSMTGYWKINLKLLNENGELIKGEDVTEDHPSSSLYFEIEF